MIYLIGSLENPKLEEVAKKLRDAGFEIFDDWRGASPDGDKLWQAYSKRRGWSYKEALKSPFVQTAFQFDMEHLKKADSVVLTMPGGRSCHLELGWALGQGKRGYILFPDGEPERYDLMANLATDVCFSTEELIDMLRTPVFREPEYLEWYDANNPTSSGYIRNPKHISSGCE